MGAESCRHTPEAELQPSIGRGVLVHKDQDSALINDTCLFVCVHVGFYASSQFSSLQKAASTFIDLFF